MAAVCRAFLAVCCGLSLRFVVHFLKPTCNTMSLVDDFAEEFHRAGRQHVPGFERTHLYFQSWTEVCPHPSSVDPQRRYFDPIVCPLVSKRAPSPPHTEL